MATLQLNLIKRWFDLTLQGIKKEEYRDITPYWAKRLLCMENGGSISKFYGESIIKRICSRLIDFKLYKYNSIKEVLNVFQIKFKEYQNTDFRNGYKSLDKVPRFIIENKGIKIGIGKEKWGFTGCIPKFIIQHGEVVEIFNIKQTTQNF